MIDTNLFGNERTYRRGVHQAFDAAYYMALDAASHEEAVAILGRAVDEAQSLRDEAIPEVRLALVDVIRERACAKARTQSMIPSGDD